MKIGYVSAILGDKSFEEVIDRASELGYKCVEMCCWPNGKAERRYAGVCHIDVNDLTEDKVIYIKDYCREKKVEISSLAFYPNNMDGDPAKRTAANNHLKKVMEASAKLGVNLVTTFIGRDQTKSVEENIELFKTVWPPLIRYAESLGVKVAIENCPMLFGRDQWPGGQNLMTTPVIWRQLFSIIDSDSFGLNFDPSHFVWQGMDYIAPIYEFKDKLFHIHFKDIKLYPERLAEVGTMAYPLDYMSPKLPGLGDVRWDRYVSALTDVGYDGWACVEVEDRAFEGTYDKVLQSLRLSKKYLEQFIAE